MDIPNDQIEELNRLFNKTYSYNEGGYIYLYIPDLQMPEGCSPEKVDVLLCPMPRDGYNSRLFFAAKIKPLKSESPNWNADGVRILEKNWYAFSWKVPQNIRLSQMIAIHLRGLL
jgi:hypothetical protein